MNNLNSAILRLITRGANYENPKGRATVGIATGALCLSVNFALFAAKLILGLVSGSIAVSADAINNLTDSAGSALTLFGFKISSKPADKEHPYGHERLEYICGLLVSIIVVFLGIQTLTSSVEKFTGGGNMPSVSPVLLIIMGLAAVIKLWLGSITSLAGKKIKSAALAASAADSLSDVATTSVIMLGMFISRYTGRYTDGVLGCIVSVYIIFIGIKLIKETADPLLGIPPSPELIDKMCAMIKETDGVLGIHDLVTHSYGSDKIFASVHVEIDASENISKSHEIIDAIEAEVKNTLGVLLVIHMDPVDLHDPRLNSLRNEVIEIINSVGDKIGIKLGFHDLRIVPGITKSNLLFDIVVPADIESIAKKNGIAGGAQGIRYEISRRIKERSPDITPVITVDNDYGS
jgi:cation diffusion facilitator family transporter